MESSESGSRRRNLEKIRSASVLGDQTRRSSIVLIDQMARIGGQAAAVARMTEEDDDFDMDNLESEHGGLFQGHAVILKSELHDLSGSKAFSFDDAFDENTPTDDDAECTNGAPLSPPRTGDVVLAYVNSEGRLCIHSGAKSLLLSESSGVAPRLVSILTPSAPSAVTAGENDVQCLLDGLSGGLAAASASTGTTDESSINNGDSRSGYGRQAVASLCGRWVVTTAQEKKEGSEISEVGEKTEEKQDEERRVLALHVQSTLHPPSGAHTSTAASSNQAILVQRSVQKLQTLAALLATTVLWVTSSSSPQPGSEESGYSSRQESTKVVMEEVQEKEEKEVLALAEACQQCRAHVQQQIEATCRVLGASFVHTPLYLSSSAPSSDQKGNQGSSLSSSYAGLFGGDDDGYFCYTASVCVKVTMSTRGKKEGIAEEKLRKNNDDKDPILDTETNKSLLKAVYSVDIADLERLKAQLSLYQKMKLESATSCGDSSSGGGSALLELMHLSVMAVELLGSTGPSSYIQDSAQISQQEENDEEQDNDDDEEKAQERDEKQEDEEEEEGEEERYANALEALNLDREAESKRHCSTVLSDLLTEHNITSGGGFEEKLFSDQFKEEKKGVLEMESISELMQAYFLRARGPALHSVLSQFLAMYLPSAPVTSASTSSSSPPPATSPSPTSTPVKPAAAAAATALSLQQCQQLNHDLKARVEKLSTVNSELEEALEQKTNKALDAWAVAQEKYTALEEITRGMHVKMASQEELIEKLKRRVLEVEKLNNAMKEGVLRMIQEEEGEEMGGQGVSFSTRASSKSSPSSNRIGNGSGGGEGGGTLSDYLSFALSCATGYDQSAAQDSSGIRWNPTSPPPTSSRR